MRRKGGEGQSQVKESSEVRVGGRRLNADGWLAESKISARDAGTQLAESWLFLSLLSCLPLDRVELSFRNPHSANLLSAYHSRLTLD